MDGFQRNTDLSHGGTTEPTDRLNGGAADTRVQEDTSQDLEQGHPHPHRHQQTPPTSPRAPNPTLSQTSLRSHTPSATGSQHTPEPADDYAWGPSHPCFPHPNPHVPFSSPLYASTRVIRIKRDWMIAGDQAPTFSNLYPEILEPVMPEQEFRTIVQHVNSELMRAFDPWSWRNWIDALLGVLSGWVWEDLGLTGTKRRLRGVEGWLEEWNARVGDKEGVRVVGLRRTGYLTVSFGVCS